MLAASREVASGVHAFGAVFGIELDDDEGCEVHREKRVECDEVASNFLQDGVEELAEYESGIRAARYDHHPDRMDALLGQSAGSTKVHAVSDALGSVYALTDASSAAVSSYAYDVYGARTTSEAGVATKWGFTGRVHDSNGDELYFRNRHLDATTGIWTRSDPVGDVDGPNRYAYARTRPTTTIDPLGLWSLLLTGEPVHPRRDANGNDIYITILPDEWLRFVGQYMASRGFPGDVRYLKQGGDLISLAQQISWYGRFVYDEVFWALYPNLWVIHVGSGRSPSL